MGDASCAAGQSCVDKCACGDTACVMSCGRSVKSPKALPLAMCVAMRCGAEDSIAAAPVAAAPDCSNAACPSKCQCAEQRCANEVTSCMGDASCAAGQSCVDKCACGDTACVMSCGRSVKSPKALPL